METIVKGLSAGMLAVGTLFEKHEYFVPEVLMCADAMQAGLDILRPCIKENSAESLGQVVIGTVQGDVHDIGKNIVKLMLDVSGFTVHDLGKDVPLDRFAEEAKRTGAEIVAMSALMTTTMMGMKKAVQMIREVNPHTAVMLGGCPIEAGDREALRGRRLCGDCLRGGGGGQENGLPLQGSKEECSMSKQRLIDAFHGKRTDTAPWVPYAGVHCAFLLQEPADKYLQDPELLAKGVLHAASRYHADGIPLLFDLSVEAQSVGCELKWWKDNVPSVGSHPCAQKTPQEAGLMLPTEDSGRWPLIRKAAERVKPGLAELDCAMMGLCCGPLTLASHLAGVRIFTDVYKNREFAAEVCRFAGEISALSARFYAEMGCEVVAIVDPVASQIKSPTFKEYVAPNCRWAIEEIHGKGPHLLLFHLRGLCEGPGGCLQRGHPCLCRR